MDLLAELAQAQRRTETKERVAKLVSTLAPADRRAVLLELLAEISSANGSATEGGDSKLATHWKIRVQRGSTSKPKAKAAPEPSEGGKTDMLVAVLTEHPRMKIRELSTRIYGDALQGSQDRTRSLLAALKRSERARNVGPGEWEIISKG